ncbi:hypothetical protein AVEN_249116-1 [Araneus ventricosus]|uniref:Uncharacterized protein n=1 Tax=Araneus ventricosus TaxID=182803 RepID=A0A4Y2CZV9_ARAVE|nr:hypothetical protein AVEN_98587-1 [Araneus ventricosus]GBM08825.1 hypothetical protein AVEN_249116-1 [Araneus ventricosus]
MSGVYTPGRVTQGVKVTPLFPANTNRHGTKTVFYLMVLRSSDYRSCTFPPMNQLTDEMKVKDLIKRGNSNQNKYKFEILRFPPNFFQNLCKLVKINP